MIDKVKPGGQSRDWALDQESTTAQTALKRNIPSTKLKEGSRPQSWFKYKVWLEASGDAL